MDSWISIGTAAARVVEGARSRMEEKSDERAQRSASALAAVSRDNQRGRGAGGEEDAGLSQGFEDHAAASRADPHCEAIASAIPGNVRLRSFQRSGPGGMR